jgi:hypothetical protein
MPTLVKQIAIIFILLASLGAAISLFALVYISVASNNPARGLLFFYPTLVALGASAHMIMLAGLVYVVADHLEKQTTLLTKLVKSQDSQVAISRVERRERKSSEPIEKASSHKAEKKNISLRYVNKPRKEDNIPAIIATVFILAGVAVVLVIKAIRS